MSGPKYSQLENRSLVRIAGEDAPAFLQGLVTCDIDDLEAGGGEFGALLTPQGKILFDFFVLRTNDGFIVDIDSGAAPDFIKRMMFYRLRAKADIGPADDGRKVFAVFNGSEIDPAGISLPGPVIADPRLAAMGLRAYLAAPPEGLEAATPEEYDAMRIALGMPESGRDFVFGDAFPHDVLMDRISGVDFAKGCYVGQEVVSRMQHRGTARKRIIPCQSASGEPLPQARTPVTAGGKTIGEVTSVAGDHGLAMIRLDRAAPYVGEGETILAGETAVTLSLQEWSGLQWPESQSGDGAETA